MVRVLTWGVFLLLTVWFLLAATPVADLYSAPLMVPAKPEKSDVIVLMSSGLIDGHWVTPDGAQRTWGALRLYKEHYAPFIISVGSEQALVQAEMLKYGGVPASAILTDKAPTTRWSAIAVSHIMKDRDWRNAVVVTSEMDVPRIRLVFAKLGVNPSFLAVPEFRKPNNFHLFRNSAWDISYHATYEYAALISYRLHGWL
jgi:uncharacterized SAM-binding protein YcdF (DUF218 family)